MIRFETEAISENLEDIVYDLLRCDIETPDRKMFWDMAFSMKDAIDAQVNSLIEDTVQEYPRNHES